MSNFNKRTGERPLPMVDPTSYYLLHLQREWLRLYFFIEIGVGLAGFGITFLFLGILLLFDKGLLAIGNILFISGLACVIGLQRTFFFFFQRHKLKASVSFFSGIMIVLMGWPMIGMILELYGFILLFRGFLPAAVNFLRMIPVLGSILNFPILRGLVDRIAGDTGRTMV